MVKTPGKFIDLEIVFEFNSLEWTVSIDEWNSGWSRFSSMLDDRRMDVHRELGIGEEIDKAKRQFPRDAESARFLRLLGSTSRSVLLIVLSILNVRS